MKRNTAKKRKPKPRKKSEMDLILSSPELLQDIEAGVKEMREGKLLTRNGKEAFDWVSESKKSAADIEKGHVQKFTNLKKAAQWLRAQKEKRQNLSEVEQRLFGRYSSGKKDLSANRKKYLNEVLLEKHSHR